MQSPRVGFTPGGPAASPYNPQTPGYETGYNPPETPGGGLDLGQADWVTTDIQVRVKRHEDRTLVNLVGHVRSVTGTMCSIFLPEKDRVINIMASCLEPITPNRGDMVSAIMELKLLVVSAPREYATSTSKLKVSMIFLHKCNKKEGSLQRALYVGRNDVHCSSIISPLIDHHGEMASTTVCALCGCIKSLSLCHCDCIVYCLLGYNSIRFQLYGLSWMLQPSKVGPLQRLGLPKT